MWVYLIVSSSILNDFNIVSRVYKRLITSDTQRRNILRTLRQGFSIPCFLFFKIQHLIYEYFELYMNDLSKYDLFG